MKTEKDYGLKEATLFNPKFLYKLPFNWSEKRGEMNPYVIIGVDEKDRLSNCSYCKEKSYAKISYDAMNKKFSIEPTSTERKVSINNLTLLVSEGVESWNRRTIQLDEGDELSFFNKANYLEAQFVFSSKRPDLIDKIKDKIARKIGWISNLE